MNEPVWWQQLVETALLGTERSELNNSSLPPELALISADHSPERAVLQTAALATNYLRAGAELPTIALPNLPVCKPETQPYAPAAAMRLLDKILDEPTPNRRLLGLWVKKCWANNWIIPPDRLVDLFTRHKEGKVEIDPDELYFVIGNRGHWLGQINNNWTYKAHKDPEEEWHEMNGLQALALYEMRITQPAKARALLEESWHQQPLAERKLLLSALNKGLSVDDEPFLEKLRTDFMAVKRPKAVQSEHFQLVSELLMSIPGSALFDEVVAELKPYFREPKGILSRLFGKPQKTVALPAQYDDFFNRERMKRLGIEISTDLPESLLILSWFATLLVKMHPGCWAILLDDEHVRPVPFFVRQSWPEGERDDIIQILSILVKNFKRAEWVVDLLPHKSLITEWPKLVELLPQPEREAIIERHLDLVGQYGNYQFLTQPDSPQWSLAFSRFIWKSMLKTWAGTPYLQGHEQAFFRDSIPVIHPGIIVDAQVSLLEFVPEQHQQTARKHLLQPLQHWLGIREKLEQL